VGGRGKKEGRRETRNPPRGKLGLPKGLSYSECKFWSKRREGGGVRNTRMPSSIGSADSEV